METDVQRVVCLESSRDNFTKSLLYNASRIVMNGVSFYIVVDNHGIRRMAPLNFFITVNLLRRERIGNILF